jgi:membrane-bound serine protease (ClpP class)
MHVPKSRPCLLLLVVFTATLFTSLLAAPLPLRADSFVLLATYDGVINPVSAEYLHDALASAQESGAQALIMQLNTPGGLDTSMQLIIKGITGATIPVVVYVSPSSGRAVSAGVFITMAAHVAAMSPGTNIGAAPAHSYGRGRDG